MLALIATVHPRRVHAVALSVVAVAGAATGLALPGAAVASSPRACQSSQLVATVGASNGAAGTIYYTLDFTNLGATCTLRGYPGVSAVSVSGRQLGSPAVRATGNRTRTVTLKAATSVFRPAVATTTLGISNGVTASSPSCHAVLAAGLRVYPPNQKAALAVPLPFAACANRGPHFLNVRAIR